MSHGRGPPEGGAMRMNYRVFQSLVYQYSNGKISRAAFMAEWEWTQKDQGIAVPEYGGSHAVEQN